MTATRAGRARDDAALTIAPEVELASQMAPALARRDEWDMHAASVRAAANPIVPATAFARTADAHVERDGQAKTAPFVIAPWVVVSMGFAITLLASAYASTAGLVLTAAYLQVAPTAAQGAVIASLASVTASMAQAVLLVRRRAALAAVRDMGAAMTILGCATAGLDIPGRAAQNSSVCRAVVTTEFAQLENAAASAGGQGRPALSGCVQGCACRRLEHAMPCLASAHAWRATAGVIAPFAFAILGTAMGTERAKVARAYADLGGKARLVRSVIYVRVIVVDQHVGIASIPKLAALACPAILVPIASAVSVTKVRAVHMATAIHPSGNVCALRDGLVTIAAPDSARTTARIPACASMERASATKVAQAMLAKRLHATTLIALGMVFVFKGCACVTSATLEVLAACLVVRESHPVLVWVGALPCPALLVQAAKFQWN